MSKYALSKAPSILIGLSLLAFTVSPIFAEDSITAASVEPLPVAKTATTSGAIGRSLVQQKMENQKTLLENRMETIKEKIASRAASLKLRLQTFKDQRKASIVERLNINLNNINQNQTEQMQKNLGTISGILDRLETRVNSGAPDIKDAAGARVAIASARSALATASAAVTAQTQKDYTVTVTSEGRIGLDVKTQRDKLHADLLALRKVVIDAKQTAANAIRVARLGSGLPESSESAREKEGANSGQ